MKSFRTAAALSAVALVGLTSGAAFAGTTPAPATTPARPSATAPAAPAASAAGAPAHRARGHQTAPSTAPAQTPAPKK
ncbi:hypothetical protein [Brevundimonas nasdae]|uniref:Uncharacterized protein n=1 Tax=Brevundimonas nasdae TaxID=172043 RepID=A0ABX8TD41_9CAUL|nr:hypothetical protein [Brevundimonas nasdae]QYC09080.1 hypothetical protein KWG56_10590 [Brevundimonas nasdae]QYC15130.1 hypothetical protein KWG63_05925 [Brevundimonas nasdae]